MPNRQAQHLTIECFLGACLPPATRLMPKRVRVPRGPLHGLTVLVVDDDADTVDMLREYLAACGATVLPAFSARTALVLAETFAFDAALVDLRMPGEDSRWFLRELRASAMDSASAPVFAVSGERHDRPDAASGFAGCFLKPVNL